MLFSSARLILQCHCIGWVNAGNRQTFWYYFTLSIVTLGHASFTLALLYVESRLTLSLILTFWPRWFIHVAKCSFRNSVDWSNDMYWLIHTKRSGHASFYIFKKQQSLEHVALTNKLLKPFPAIFNENNVKERKPNFQDVSSSFYRWESHARQCMCHKL